MTPVTCRVKHDPENGTYGDCLRACVATLLDMGAEAVPHFQEDDCSGEDAYTRMIAFLAPHGLVPFRMAYDAVVPLETILEFAQTANPDVYYMLFGETDTGPHVVVCKGDKVVHNPAWYGCTVRRASGEQWVVVVLARK